VTRWHTIGVIGGMGPAATVDFLGRLVAGSGAAGDADHPRVLVDINPQVPDRNAALAGIGVSPGPALVAMARRLVGGGATVLAMPCNAAHVWAGEIEAALAGGEARFVNIVDAAVAALVGARRVGIIAVGATLSAQLYQKRLASAGIASLECDLTIVHPLVHAIKAGDVGPAVRAAMVAEAVRLVADGADAILAACSEVPLVLSADDVTVRYVDATGALAAATLAAARLE
jgi:aspartate racemase